MSITRRLFLRNTAAAGMVTGAVSAPVVAEAQLEATAQERFKHHLKEFKRAAEEIDPRIGWWNVGIVEDADLKCPIVISAHRVSGRYEGDGIYEIGGLSVTGLVTRYEVRLRDELIDGHQTFSVRSAMDSMVLTKPRFETFMGRRVA